MYAGIFLIAFRESNWTLEVCLCDDLRHWVSSASPQLTEAGSEDSTWGLHVESLALCEGLLACHAQSAIHQERERLLSVRVKEDSALAAEVASISGQQVPAAATLEELLRRPHVHYRSAAMHLLRGVLSPSYIYKAKCQAHLMFPD